ncbi:MAG: TonB-dependent receptor [Verrucomicrobiota bacterium]
MKFSSSSAIRSTLLLAALPCFIGIHSVHAADKIKKEDAVTVSTTTEVDDDNQIEKTVWVASKSPKAASSVSPSVDSVSGGELKVRQLYQLEDVLSFMPGVSVVQTGQTGGQTSLFIRGMESNHTVTLLNGRRLAPGLAGTYNMELLDTTFLESVELYRGPISSLYGSDAIAGALNLQMTDARQVADGTQGQLFIEGGSFETSRIGSQLTYGQGPVGVVIDASFLDTANDQPQNDFRNFNLRSNIAIELAEGVTFDLLGYLQDSLLQVPGSTLSDFYPEGQLNDNRTWLLSPRLTIERDSWDLSAYYSYNENRLNATQDVFLQDNRLEQTSNEVEVKLNIHPTDNGIYTVGVAYFDYDFSRTPLVNGAFNTPGAKEYGYFSFFGQADVDLPLNLNLLASARWDEHDSFESKGTYSVQLAHQIEATDTQLFAKVATGYKAPSGQDFVFLAPSVDPNSLSPEESFSYEFGIRQNLPNRMGNLTAIYFNTDIENLIDSVGFPSFPSQVDTQMDGFEFGLNLTPVRGLSIYTNYTYLNAVITRGQYLGGFGGGPGDRLSRRPRHTLSGGFIYRTLDWKFGAELRGGYDRYDGPGTSLGDYTVARVYGSYYLKDNVELFARAENVFDENYQTTTGYRATGFGAFGGIRLTF